MINFDDVIKQNIKERNPNWPEIIGGFRIWKNDFTI